MKARKRTDEARDIAPSRLDLDGNGDGVPVVFDVEENRQLPRTSSVESLPELAFAGRPFSKRGVNDFVGMKQRLAVRDDGHGTVNQARFSRAHSMEQLRRGGARAGNDVQRSVSPMRRHLAPGVAGVVLGADRSEQHFVGGDTELEAERPVAVVRMKPVVPGSER